MKSALDPVIAQKLADHPANPIDALLSITVCDPSCGSGHFLIAAAHRIARNLAVVQTGEGEPPLEALREALRDVIANCIYGVDINPLAVELCKVALWLESLDPRKPLGFLDHRIKCGNSIIGATPELLKEGIPDDAFKPVEGDDPAVASSIRRKNKEERKGQQDLFMIQEDRSDWWEAASAYATWASLPEDNIKQVSEKARQYDTLLDGRAIRHQHDLADLWTAAFFWPLTKETYDTVPTQDVFRHLRDGAYALTGKTAGRVKALAEEHRFFHWHLEFPEVFMKQQGFDCVVGNPPWEKITTLGREFFSAIPEIVEEKRSDRRKALILALRDTDSVLYDRWIQQLRFDAATMHFMRTGGRFPLSAVGELNLYPLFVELSQYLTRKSGTVGMIIKTGMMLSPTWADFSSYLLENDRIESAFDFRNWNGWFPDIGYHERFTLLTMKKGRQKRDIVLGYYLDDTAEIRDASKTFTIARDEAIRLNPITKTVPAFESSLHKTCVMAVYDRFPVLGDKASEWEVHYTTGLHMAAEADKLRDFEELSSEGFEPDEFLRMKRGERAFVPLYEGKFIHQFDHRFASFEGIPRKNRFGIKAGTHNPTEDQKKDPAYHITPRYWISEEDAASDREARHLRGNWAIAFRDTTNVISNFRTSVACICSGVAFNYKAPNIMLEGPAEQKRAKDSLLFVALMNSFPFDFVVRQKFFGANFIKSILLQLAAPSMTVIQRHQSFILPRVLELSYTSWQLEGFAAECGFEGQPFIWDEIRRLQIRAELDALFFHIYGFSVDDAAFILDSYRILRDKDEDKFGEYRTKRLILEIYDTMQRAKDTGQSYQTHLSPSPGPPPTADGSFISMYRLDRANWPTHMHPPHPDWDESILNAWFDVCRGQWNYLEEHQVFPWVGRETFIYALIPYLIQEKPGAKFEFYRDAASLASCPERLETLLLDDNLRNEYRQLIFDIAWIRFPKDHRIRPRLIRETLQNKQIIQTTADSGITMIHGTCRLPPFPKELKPLLPLMLKAAVNLDKMQRHTLEDAEAAKMTFTQDEIAKELKALSAA
ncbi:MAG: hypothetical protein NTY86_15795 [Deltaproteobacteria bacterium]|nr:hypothetical protein [Deltaproteobacteria bacterium]